MTVMELTTQISDAVARILAEADVDIGARKPVCLSSGRCCHFEEWGHRLYVTGVELMHFAQVHAASDENRTQIETKRSISLPQFFAADAPRGCPYQVDQRCTAREARPLGCRIYFCDENARGWQNEVYEKYHARLRDVHAGFGVPYRYIEWRAALRELVSLEDSA